MHGNHYKIYASILISVHRTAGPSCCLFFVISNIFVVRKTSKTANIHGCCLIISHTPPTIQANIASSWLTYKKVGKCTTLIFILIWFGLLHRYNIQDNTGWLFVIVLHVVKRFVWYCSVFTQYSYYRDFFCSGPSLRLRDQVIGLSNRLAGRFELATELELNWFRPLPLGELVRHLSTQVNNGILSD